MEGNSTRRRRAGRHIHAASRVQGYIYVCTGARRSSYNDRGDLAS